MITVFTPTYNRANTLWRTFLSLQAQTDQRFEWVIIDDGSTDHTAAVIDRINSVSKSFNLKYRYKQNQGKHTTYKLAASMASFDYICMLDSDDEFFSWTVESCINRLIPMMGGERDKIAGCLANASNHHGYIDGYYLKESIATVDLSKIILRNFFGDKFELWKVKVLREFSFPENLQGQYVPESVLYHQIARSYRIVTSSAVCIVKWQDSRGDHLNDQLVVDSNLQARNLAHLTVLNCATRCVISQPIAYIGNVVGYIKTSAGLGLGFLLSFSRLTSLVGNILFLIFSPIFLWARGFRS